MNDLVAKMYAQLTPAELGVLAVKYLIAGDDLEVGRITKACPSKTYTMQDVTYSNTIENFLRMTNAWGLLYWQHQHERMRAALRLAIALSRGMETEEDEAEVESRGVILSITESCLLAMEVALDEVCAARGFDAADARKIVDAQTFEPFKSSEALPDPGTLDKVKDLLLCILEENGK